MSVDPYLEPLLARLPELPEEIDWTTYRPAERAQADAFFAEVGEPGPQVKERHEITIPVTGATVELFVYEPFEPGQHPSHLFLHGGAFSMGTIRQAVIDTACRERCIGAGCVVFAVDYRKAPEHRFPTGLNDCYAALRWLAVGYGLTRHTMERMRRDYLPSLGEATNPYASPLLAPGLAGLPPAHVMTAEYDPLRDEGEAYARRLTDAGVPATYSMIPGHIHGSGAFTKVMASARAWRAEVTATLQRLHGAAQPAYTSELTT